MVSKGYYTIPLTAKSLMTSKGHKKCNLKESIAHHLHLITTSYFGECAFDESFGCSIWLIDFDNLKSTSRLKGQIVESLYTSLARYESRLEKVKIGLKIKQQELDLKKLGIIIKKRIDITIQGRVKKTSEEFIYNEYFYIGPLSY